MFRLAFHKSRIRSYQFHYEYELFYTCLKKLSFSAFLIMFRLWAKLSPNFSNFGNFKFWQWYFVGTEVGNEVEGSLTMESLVWKSRCKAVQRKKNTDKRLKTNISAKHSLTKHVKIHSINLTDLTLCI